MARKVSRKPDARTREETGSELFVEAVRSLRPEDIPVKTADHEDDVGCVPRDGGAAERVLDTIDLHGMTVEQALQYLSQTLDSLGGKSGRVHIVVGRGLHSPGGQGVLREIIPAWLDRKGCASVARWSWARKKQGGGGVIVATLCPRTAKKRK